ncbi:glycosyltransferase family 4 protein [Azorhizobium doebereinerae]|uniref:glycosyltransferase family 4 protein n=1 Tax=Azorhizobium doebereinerae TaxID=281091 RepID=UPI0004036520|nr:glycosyltransferase family 4 protein [Azorhizobium doebereinerae]
MRAILAFPGTLDTPTGGYAYDRAVLKALPGQGVAIAPLALPPAFPFADPADLDTTARHLRAAPPDSVLLIDGLALGVLPADMLRALEQPVVALIHHPLAREAGLSDGQKARFAASERAALSACAGVIATSPATGRDLTAHYDVAPHRLTIAEPGVAPAPRAAADGDPPRLLAVGSVIPRKNYAGLVEALAQARDLRWQLTIIGGLGFAPDTVAEVRARIARHQLGDRVTLHGAVAPEALEAAYAACDLFVHPSLYEGYGMVLADALRRGLPMICTTGGAAGETVPDGAALKVPPGDTAALAAALRSLLAAPAERRRLADAAALAGRALPTWDDTAARIAAALRAVRHAVTA